MLFETSRCRQTDLDHCPGTFSTEKGCIWLLRHRSLVWCEIDTVSFKKSLLVAVEVFARQIINEESDIVGDANVQAAPNVSGNAINRIHARRKKL